MTLVESELQSKLSAMGTKHFLFGAIGLMANFNTNSHSTRQLLPYIVHGLLQQPSGESSCQLAWLPMASPPFCDAMHQHVHHFNVRSTDSKCLLREFNSNIDCVQGSEAVMDLASNYIVLASSHLEVTINSFCVKECKQYNKSWEIILSHQPNRVEHITSKLMTNLR